MDRNPIAYKSGKRKTFSILDMIREVNRRNRESTCSADVRQGWNSMLESILMASNVYAGFGYYKAEELPKGEKPGIIPDGNPDYPENSNCRHVFPDETRIFFYADRKLTHDRKGS